MSHLRALVSIRTVGCVLALFGALQATAYAQAELPYPELNAVTGLGPDESEFSDGTTANSIEFGWTIALHRNTALVQEAGYPKDTAAVGRVAVFTRNSAGTWERNGSIDPQHGPFPNGPFQTFGEPLAIVDDVALIGSPEGMSVYHRKNGNWKLVQQLHLKAGWFFTDVALNGRFAFLATSLNSQGVVYAYRINPNGRLKYLQRLDSGVDFDFYAEHLALSGDRLVVSAIGDNEDRGAAYVFERSGSRWVKKQKLVADNAKSGDLFSSTVAIADDWIAVGSSNFTAKGGEGCPGGRNRGAFYVFHRVDDHWQQQQFVPADQLAGTASCVVDFGHRIVMNGTWIVADAGAFLVGDADLDVPVIFRRDAGDQYTPIAKTSPGGGLQLALSGNTLITAEAVSFNCENTVCIGEAKVYDLGQIP
jgi:hypothetical protein